MTFHQRAARVLLIVVGLAMMVGAARAQSITVGPARPGGNPASLSNTSFPGSVSITVGSFSATPTGGASGSTISLAWSGLVNATACSIDQGVGSVTCANSSTNVAPAVSTTYTLTASNSVGSTTRTATVFVVNPVVATSTQRGTLSMGTSVGSVTSSSLVVANSALTRVRVIGSSTSQDNDSSGLGYAIVNIIDGTHVSVTYSRQSTISSISVSMNYEVVSYDPSYINSIQRVNGVASNSGTAFTITSVNVNKTEVDYLGGRSNCTSCGTIFPYMSTCTLSAATTVTCTGGTAGSSLISAQTVEWK